MWKSAASLKEFRVDPKPSRAKEPLTISASMALVLAVILCNFMPASIGPVAAADTVQATSSVSPGVAALGNKFVSNLPPGWTSAQGSWAYVNPLACWQHGTNCSGNNPTTTYGYPTLPASGTRKQEEFFQLDQNDAVVIFYQTPPPVAYYAFTQYLTSQPGQPPITASLSNSLNLQEISTIGSTGPGQNAFNSMAVIVWTANVSTYNMLVAVLAEQGITAANVNFIPLPINMGSYPGWTGAPLPPLQMGMGSTGDQFNMFMRSDLPTSQTDWQTYMASMPFFVLRVSPPKSFPLSPAPTVGYATATTGLSESNGLQNMPALQSALNDLVTDIQTTNGMTWTFSSETVEYSTTTGWQCILKNTECGDNYDELSSLDSVSRVKVKNLQDIVIIAGVNHALTNKGLYFNHAVYDTTNKGGVASFTNQDVSSTSALYWAGVTNPSDPRVQEYQSLYAYAISYDCTGLQYCLAIPAPTSGNPVGLAPGSQFELYGRVVEDPVRVDPPLNIFVRPSTAEIVAHQTLLGTFNN